MIVAFFFEFRRQDLSRETGGNLSVKPDSEAKYAASISLPLFNNSSIISAKFIYFVNQIGAIHKILMQLTEMQLIRKYKTREFITFSFSSFFYE